MTIWGKIIEALRSQRGITQGDFARRLVIGKDAYYRLCRSKRGPTILTLDTLLRGMRCTWHDWAYAYDTIARLQGKVLRTAPPKLNLPSAQPSKESTRKPGTRT